jgi:hypothetical protein
MDRNADGKLIMIENLMKIEMNEDLVTSEINIDRNKSRCNLIPTKINTDGND